MTVAAAQAQLLMLTMSKSDLEYRLMSVSTQRQALALESSEYAQYYAAAGGSDISNDPYMLRIQYLDKQLEIQQGTLETQQQSVAAQVESVEKLLDNNIKKDFKMNFGG